MARYYEFDAAMMGDMWIGGHDELRAFAVLLNEELDASPDNDIEAVAHTSTHNGADSHSDGVEEYETDDAWERAMNRTPAEWWRQ